MLAPLRGTNLGAAIEQHNSGPAVQMEKLLIRLSEARPDLFAFDAAPAGTAPAGKDPSLVPGTGSGCSDDAAPGMGAEGFGPSALRWAYGMYISRRYPARLCPTFVGPDDPSGSSGGAEQEGERSERPCEEERVGPPTGVMVPLLGLLNQ